MVRSMLTHTASHARRYVAAVGMSASVGPAPSRFRLWNPGPNPWDGGVVNFTPAAAAAVMAEFVRRGSNPLLMDIEHAITLASNPADPLPTAGYCVPEVVDTPEGPALDILPRWSDCVASSDFKIT